ncbi:hypothetical protein [Enhydrobacter sp.]|jgi:ribosomal protein S19E (S16A)|uniref:hypothetical protein n=1 Tax=Enhydrobacter sp. TaxID=1894999 RepID=UPI00262F9CA6|nr:hypothetical protein [Enhydrobacter sp.]WIM09305.1 MAG: hypothetical protein OJF58_000256 [Enhydrobacter sp.]
MTLAGNGGRPGVLTDEEEVTLRRVAYGESEVKAMRARDLARLRKLGLIEDAKDGPRLTEAGRSVFNGLPKAAGRDSPRRVDDMLREMAHLLRDRGR